MTRWQTIGRAAMKQTRQWAEPEVMALNRPGLQAGAALKEKPQHKELHN